jgi:hypothetical protein
MEKLNYDEDRRKRKNTDENYLTNCETFEFLKLKWNGTFDDSPFTAIQSANFKKCCVKYEMSQGDCPMNYIHFYITYDCSFNYDYIVEFEKLGYNFFFTLNY